MKQNPHRFCRETVRQRVRELLASRWVGLVTSIQGYWPGVSPADVKRKDAVAAAKALRTAFSRVPGEIAALWGVEGELLKPDQFIADADRAWADVRRTGQSHRVSADRILAPIADPNWLMANYVIEVWMSEFFLPQQGNVHTVVAGLTKVAELHSDMAPKSYQLLQELRGLTPQRFNAPADALLVEIIKHFEVLLPKSRGLRRRKRTPSENSSSRRKAKSTESSQADSYVFRMAGELWDVQFGQESGRFKEIDGIFYIVELLRMPKTRISATRLSSSRPKVEEGKSRHALNEKSGEVVAREVVYSTDRGIEAADEQSIKAVEARLREIDKELAAGGTGIHIEKREDLEEEHRECKKYLSEVTNARGEPRQVKNRRRSVINSVRQGIDRAIRKFINSDPPMRALADHLEKSLTYKNGEFEYHPPSTISWLTR